jgi:hypothetical protein
MRHHTTGPQKVLVPLANHVDLWYHSTMEKRLITSTELARELGMNKSNMINLISRQFPEIKAKTVRPRESHYQKTSAYTAEDADKVRQYRSGFSRQEKTTTGFTFYLIVPIPQALPNRVKLGITGDLPGRLRHYKTMCPELSVRGSWPLEEKFEKAVIHLATRHGVKHISDEVFDVEDIKAFQIKVEKAIKLFTTGL